MPLLLNVPYYKGIRMHNGVDHTHTAGCLITGLEKDLENDPWRLLYGRKAYNDLMEILKLMCSHEKVYIVVTNEREENGAGEERRSFSGTA